MTQARNGSPVDPDRHSLFDNPESDRNFESDINLDPEPIEPPAPIVERPLIRADESEDPVDAAPQRPRFNPFLALLWLLAAGLVGAGFWAQARALDSPAPNPGEPPTVEQFYVIPAVLGAVAPSLIAIGVAAIVVAVSLHALQWIRSHGS